MKDLWILYTVQAGCSLLPLLFIWLVPTKTEVENVQKAIDIIESSETPNCSTKPFCENGDDCSGLEPAA